ncbi:MAG: NAD(P)/FAD-dependent oxidoreductase [Lachnospiraceae bacterium]|nr:NAD(P)/FAD-dependent oxidoreductase [Lachnospiraceae bacterium]
MDEHINENIIYDVLVIGGGASGMMASIMAARSGRRVIVIDKNNAVGKKILSTGNGRCNFSNKNVDASYYPDVDGERLERVFERFSLGDTIEFFRQLGIYPVAKDGWLYPICEQARSVRDVLWEEMKHLGVEIITDNKVVGVNQTPGGYIVVCEHGSYDANKCIIATGGLAAPKCGCDGDGYRFAQDLGHTLSYPLPALTSLVCHRNPLRKAEGIRIAAEVRLFVDDRETAVSQGQMQITGGGISGIPVFQISRYASRALYENHTVRAEVRFLPQISAEDMQAELAKRFRKKELSEYQCLIGLFPDKLIDVLLRAAGCDPDAYASDISVEGIKALEVLIESFPLAISGTGDFYQAQVTTGGVPLLEVDCNTMESTVSPGLYLCGEVLDVDGECGGYNLQWAWSSGALAGMSAGA